MNEARISRIFLAVWGVLSLAFAIAAITGGTASAIMAFIGAALVGAVIWVVLRAIMPTKSNTDVGGSA